MNKIKQFLSEKSIGYYLFAASALLGLITFIIYVARGGDSMTDLSAATIALMIIGVVLNIALLVKNFTPLEIIPFVFYIAGFMTYIGSEIMFITNVMYGVDGNVLDGAFFAIIVFGVLSIICGITACIMRIGNKKAIAV